MKLITVPHQLQIGTEFNEAMPLLNDNFKTFTGAFNGFGIENVLGWPNNTNSAIVAAGGMVVGQAASIGATEGDVVKAIFPKFDLFVDPPLVPAGGTGYDPNYLFPTGAALTTNQKKLILTVYAGISSTDFGLSFIGSDGLTYFFQNDLTYAIRNSDTSSHLYALVISASVYTTSGATFR